MGAVLLAHVRRSVKVSFSHMQINSIVDAARITSRAEAEAGVGTSAPGAGAKRQRDGGDAMAELEAEAVAAMGLGAGGMSGRTALSGFVSAGVIQQGNDREGGAPGAKAKAPAAGAAMPNARMREDVTQLICTFECTASPLLSYM
jgi:pre-mRNA-splicing factor SYF1